MKKIKAILFCCICFLLIFTTSTFSYDNIKLIPIADIVYIDANLLYPFISGISSSNNKDNLKINDVIISINSIKISNSTNLLNDLNQINLLKDDDLILINLLRNGMQMKKQITVEEFKKYTLNHSIGAIGTITAIDENGHYVGLAHDLKLNNSKLMLKESYIYKTGYVSQNKSHSGNVGNLVVKNINKNIGVVNHINYFGIKGYYENFSYDTKKSLEIAKPKVGEAYIYCKTPITNKLKRHKIIITKVCDDISYIEVLDKSLIKFRMTSENPR